MKTTVRHAVLGIGDPHPVTDIVILEDDTCGVLAAPPGVREYDEHPIHLHSSLQRFKPYPLGHLRRHRNTLYAMVVELGHDPICTPDSVEEAAGRLARHPLVHTAGSIRLQMLGCIYATIEPKISYSALMPLFKYLNRSGLRQLYLQVRPEHKPIVSKLIQHDS